MKDDDKSPSQRSWNEDLTHRRHVELGRTSISPEIRGKVQEVAQNMINGASIEHRPTILTSDLINLSPNAAHDSKADLMKEYKLLEKAEKSLTQSLHALYPEDNLELRSRFRNILNVEEIARTKSINTETATGLIESNIAQSGFYNHTLWGMLHLQQHIQNRITFLDTQIEDFWSASHRAPAPYPRLIALRLAKVYANYWQEKPKANTSSHGKDATGRYSQSIEEIFEILKIDQHFLQPAQWAVKQITQEDLDALKSRHNFGGILRAGSFTPKKPTTDQP